MSHQSPSSGHIFQINLSAGGVPKYPVRDAQVDVFGVRGDGHNDTEHHGGPIKAVCLYSLERILALQAEGHPIFPGAIGENITVAGLDWSQVVAGVRLALGDAVVLEITRYATPCANIRPYFSSGQIERVSWRTNDGWARAYARVLRPGPIVTGDAVRVIAPGA